MKKILCIIIFILSLEIASAAILHGTIYDTKLTKLNDVVVEVNSTPSQIFVSKEGQYSFVLEPGEYMITAKYKIGGSDYLYSSDNVTIAKDGYFLVDLFLKPAKMFELPPEEAVGIGNIIRYSVLISIISAILLILLGFTIYRLKSNKQIINESLDDYTAKLLGIIKKEGGRTTQKDIRKEIPLSEAKISLMITELETKGLVKRIKKGRGNIIILEKK